MDWERAITANLGRGGLAPQTLSYVARRLGGPLLKMATSRKLGSNIARNVIYAAPR
jgi:hypothetical protein